MKERPIIFSAPMVRAILEGRKTQTRRVAKIPLDAKDAFFDDECDSHCWSMEENGMDDPHAKMLRNPYGERGDRLWVKETWRVRGGKEYEYQKHQPSVVYRADVGEFDIEEWRPSIFMPRWASRITLEIEHDRVERLHDITEDDAQAEGCDPFRVAYKILWNSINGHGSWHLNPWVWVIEFKRV